MPLIGMYELVVYFRIVRVAEVKAVGDGHRFAAAAYNVAGCFCHGDLSADMRVGIYVTAVTVGSNGQCLFSAFYQHDRQRRWVRW